MDNETFESLIKQWDEKRLAIITRKGKDYDQVETDRLSSFKKVAAICKELEVNCTTPSGIADVLLILKLVRDANLKVSGKSPQNESVEDTVLDAHNYIDLRQCCRIDEQQGAKQ